MAKETSFSIDDKEKLKEEIITYVKEMSRTCVELVNKFPILKPKQNEKAYFLHLGIDNAGLSNMIIWEFSEIGSQIISELGKENKITFRPMESTLDRSCYFIDGGGLRLPIAKRPPREGYKEPHWVPCWVVTYEKWLEWKNS